MPDERPTTEPYCDCGRPEDEHYLDDDDNWCCPDEASVVERIEIEMPTVLLDELKYHVQHEPVFYESVNEYILYAIRREIRNSRTLKQDDTGDP